MTRLRLVLAAVVFLIVALRTTPARAQMGAGTLTGTVADAEAKKPAADVVVTLTSPSLQGEQVVVTDSAGFYRVPDLPPGRYAVQFEKDGFKPYSRDGVELRGDSTLRLNAELLPDTLTAQEVVVQARAPTVDVGSSTTGMTITSEFTSRVPVSAPSAKGAANRSFESVAVVAPGAHADDYGVSIAGTTSVENQYLIDGLSVGNPAFGFLGSPLSSEFVQQMSVITGGYLPEYGRSTGGVLNAVTKTGSNEFHGDAFLYYSPGALAGWRHPVQRQNGSVAWSSSLAYLGDFGADVGGPVVKDKLWFYAGFDLSRTQYDVQRSINRVVVDASGHPLVDANGFTSTEELSGTSQHGVAQATTLQAIGKLTWAASDHNRLTLTAFMSPTTSGGPGKFGIDPRTGQPEVGTNTGPGSYTSVAHQFPSSAYDAALKWSADAENKHVLVDTTLGWHHEAQALLPSDGSTPGSGAGLSNVWQTLWQRNTTPHSVTDFENLPNPSLCTPSAAAAKSGVTTLCPLGTYTSGGTGDINQQSYDRYQLGSVVTYIVQAAGHHIIKAGASVEYTDYYDLKGDTGGAQTQETPDGRLLQELYGLGILSSPDHPQSLEPLHYHTQSYIAGGFLQDSWSVLDQVTVNVGLRYDAQMMYASDGGIGLSLPDEWSPRAGVIYDPTQAGRAKLFANYARYYENVPLDLADASLTGEPYIQSYHSFQGCNPLVPSQQHAQCQAPGNRVNSPDDSPTSPNRKWVSLGAGSEPVDPNIQAQSSDEFVAGGEYELVPGGRGGLSYTKRWQNKVIEDMSLDNAQTFFIGNPGYGIGSQFPKA
ncbi:MAG TPA: TonB-dependent receptor, partial [Polyangiaceae bacterium]